MKKSLIYILFIAISAICTAGCYAKASSKASANKAGTSASVKPIATFVCEGTTFKMLPNGKVTSSEKGLSGLWQTSAISSYAFCYILDMEFANGDGEMIFALLDDEWYRLFYGSDGFYEPYIDMGEGDFIVVWSDGDETHSDPLSSFSPSGKVTILNKAKYNQE